MIDIARNTGDEPVPIKEDCPECGSSETFTSRFAADHADELPEFSSWCESCGWGWSGGTLAE